MKSTMRDHPPAYLENTGKEESHTDDMVDVNGETGVDSATAKLCV